tara:strand:- start:23157 stop:23321 length:165 start_codon:yes stop_codon:yes gene_type:complete
MPRKYTNKLLEGLDEGIYAKDEIINACLTYMSEDDVADMCHSEGLIEEDEEGEE